MAHNYERVIFWLRRDLRLFDNKGLAEATKDSGEVFLVFVYDTQILSRLKDKNDRRLTYIWKILCDLQASLHKQQGSLILLHGDPVVLIPQLAERLKAQSVYTNRDYESYALSRDNQVQAKLNDQGIGFRTFKDHIVFEAPEVAKQDNSPYTVFTPFKRSWLGRLDLQPEAIHEQPVNLSKIGRIGDKEAEGLPIIQDLGQIGFLEAARLPIEVTQAGIKKQLGHFLEKGLFAYKSQRDYPGIDGTSNLSPHLRFGTLSIRECIRAILDRQKDANYGQKQESETWLSELIWREFYSAILQAFPYVQEKSFKPEYQNILWRVDQRLLEAWREGMTGYPIVDAGMRQLKLTGQMPNRVRMITASFLTKDLLLDWKEGEAHFARYLLDFDLASNNGGWQWASSTGTDAAPYFRIFNPQLQGAKFDAETRYIKNFLPELKDVPASKIHDLDFDVQGYPKPIVRHDLAREAVMELFKIAKSK